MMMGRRVINRENKKIYHIIFKKIKVIGNRIEDNNFTTGHRMTNAIFPTIIIRPKANTNQIIPLKTGTVFQKFHTLSNKHFFLHTHGIKYISCANFSLKKNTPSKVK